MFNKFRQSFKLFLLVLKTSRKIDIRAIQQKYGYDKQRRIKITIHDTKRSFYVTVKEGRMTPLNLTREYDNEIEIERLYTLKYIANGEKPALSHNHKLIYTPYALMDAWTTGDISSDGRASTNLVFCVVDIVTECMRYLDVEELDKILPDTADDYLADLAELVQQKRRSFIVSV